MDGVEHRNSERRVATHQCVAVVEEHLSETHESVVDLGDPRLRRLLVAPDRLDDVPAKRARCDGEARKADLREPVGDVVEAGTPWAHHEHALVLGDEHADGVDDRLRPARSRQRLDDEGVARADLGDDVLLLFVGVEQQRVRRGRALILSDRLDGPVRLFDDAAGGWVACQRVEHQVVEVLGFRAHAAGHIRERRHHQARLNVEPGEMGGEPPQAIDDRLRLEDSVGERQRDERLGVESDLELLGQRTGELGIEERLALQLQFEVATVTADGQGAHQDRRHELVAAMPPLGETDRQVHGFDAAHRPQFDAFRRDRVRRKPRVAQGQLVADEARQQRALAGDELREAARMRRTQLDARAGTVVEVEQGRPAAEILELFAPASPDRLRDVARDHVRVPETQLVRLGGVPWVEGVFGSGIRRHVVLLMSSVESPHTATIRAW